MPSNFSDEPLIYPCGGPNVESFPNQMHSESAGLIDEINSYRGEILVRGFWTRDRDCIVDSRICYVNQKYYLTKNPSAVIKLVEAEKK